MNYQIIFVLNFICCYFCMKTASWLLVAEKPISLRAFFESPYLAMRSFQRVQGKRSAPALHFLIFTILTILAIRFAARFAPLDWFEIMFFSPTIYFFIEALGAFGQLVFYSIKTFPIHHKPLKACSLGHFWGRDWNVWIQDWLRDVARHLGKGKHHHRIAIVFFISGFFHEIMCNLPYWIVYRKSYFGTMMGYFLIQAMLLWIDKKMISHLHPLWRRIYLWAAVIVPSPLFINVPLLTFFGLSHE